MTNPVSSTFGGYFADAAAESGARVRHDGFDDSVLEVQKEDLNRFISVLLLAM